MTPRRTRMTALVTALTMGLSTVAVRASDCPVVMTLRASIDGKTAELVKPNCDITKLGVDTNDQGESYLDASAYDIVTVESIPSVVSVNLAKNKITSMTTGDNEAVFIVDLSDNGLTDLSILNLPRSVYSLTLDDNAISGMRADTVSSRVSTISLRNNNITSLSSFSFASDVRTLDLSRNQLTKLQNFQMPVALQKFTCRSCGIQEMGGIAFTSELLTLDLAENDEIANFEVSEDSVPVLEGLEEFGAETTTKTCSDPDATLTPVRTVNLCVLPTEAFNAKYKVKSTVDKKKDTDASSKEGNGASGGTSTAGSTSGEASATDWAKLAMISVGALVLVVLVVIFVVMQRRRKKRQADKLEFHDGLNPHTSGATQFIQGGTSTLTGGTTAMSAMQTSEYLPNDIRTDEDLQQFRLAQSDVHIGKLIAKGGYGAVYMASFRNEAVVVKQMLPDKTRNKQILKSFMDEIRICAQLDHPKIPKFIGITWSSLLDISMIIEYMPNGDLATLLADQLQLEKTYPGPQGARGGFGWFHSNAKLKCKSLIALDIAEALVYLHSLENPIIHRDLKPKNVLMGANWEAKVTDFGISREMDEDLTMTAEIGTVSWIAPEVLRGERYSERADVYSFGVIMSELDTCQRPYAAGLPNQNNNNNNGATGQVAHSNTRIAVLVSSGQLKPSVHRDCPRSVRKLVKRCLAYRPEDRPSALQIHYELRHLELEEDEIMSNQRESEVVITASGRPNPNWRRDRTGSGLSSSGHSGYSSSGHSGFSGSGSGGQFGASFGGMDSTSGNSGGGRSHTGSGRRGPSQGRAMHADGVNSAGGRPAPGSSRVYTSQSGGGRSTGSHSGGGRSTSSRPGSENRPPPRQMPSFARQPQFPPPRDPGY